MKTSALVLIALVAGLATGCGGSKHAATTSSSTRTTVSARQDTAATLEHAVRTALNENFRLSLYVLSHNSIPTWALQSTRGPALTALRSAAATRRGRGLRIRSQPGGHYTILSVRLDPSYERATALVHDRRQVVPYRNGKRLGRAIKVDDHARIELRRLGDAARFVVWRVTPVH
jgi:hypothetical protein